jgi:effector-binding domain-containing protein
MLAAAGPAGLVDVVVRPVRAELVATLRADGDVPAAFYAIEGYVQRHAARAPRPPMTLVGPDGAATVAVPVTWRLPAAPGVSVATLPPVPAMACSVHRGRYAGLGGHVGQVLTWLERTGRRPAGPLRRVYLRFGAEPELRLPAAYLTDDPEELVTEVQVPL